MSNHVIDQRHSSEPDTETQPGWARSRRTLWLLAGIVLLGLLVRSYKLDRSFVSDEFCSIWTTQQSITAILSLKAACGLNTPTYFLLLHIWTGPWSAAALPAEVVTRSLSVLTGALAIPLLYWVGRTLFNAPVGLLAALLLALSPLHIQLSQVARTYSLLMFFAPLSVALFIQALRRNSVFYWGGYIFATMVALYLHAHAVFVLAFQGVFFILIYRAQQGLLKPWLLTQSILALLLVPDILLVLRNLAGVVADPWLAGVAPLAQLGNAAVAFSVGHTAVAVSSLTVSRMVSIRDIVQTLPILVPIVVAFGAALVSAVRPDRRYNYGLLFCVLWLGLPVLLPFALALAGFKAFNIRYLVAALPAYCLLLALGIYRLKRGYGLIVAGGIMVLSLYSLGNYYFREAYFGLHEDWRGAAQLVKSNLKQGDTVLFYNSDPEGFKYYWTGELPNHLIIDRGTETLKEEWTKGAGRLWLVYQETWKNVVDPDNLVMAWLDSRFEVALERPFSRLVVKLYQVAR